MDTSRKQITFDLDTQLLRDYYPKKSWRHAYDDIRSAMSKNGFEWIEGSVYISKNPIDTATVSNLIKKVVQKHNWLNVCMRDCVVTNIGAVHSLNHLFDKDADIPKRIDNDITPKKSKDYDLTM